MADDYVATTSTTGQITVGGLATGELDTVGDKDWFAVSLSAGREYTFTLESAATNGLQDPYLRLYSIGGTTMLEESDDANGLNSQIDVTITASGTYYLEASSGTNPDSPAVGTRMGNYVLAAVAAGDDYTANASTTGVVSVGGAATGQVETAGDKDWFAVQLEAGKIYSFTLNSGTTNGLTDPSLSLYRSDGTLISSNDDSDGLNSQIAYTASATGTYYLSAGSGASGNGTGAYTLNASLPIADDYLATTKTTGQVTAGGSTSGQLEYADDSDWFAISLTAGQLYTFALDTVTTNGLADPLLSLYSSTGTLINSDDDGSAPNARLTYTPSATGTYYLGASSSPNFTGVGTGSYTVSSSFPSVNGITYVTATGGDDTISSGTSSEVIDGGSGADTVVFNSTRANYTVAKTTTGYTVQDNSGIDGTNTVSNIESLKFSDMTVNLTVQAKAAAAPPADLQRLNELYVAFFNRVPDADGLAYWIDQMTGGRSVTLIAESFYDAGVQNSSSTGYSASMSNEDFVNVVYRNVLGRTTGADAEGLAYWSGELAAGRATHGSLVSDILTSAHTFKTDATYGWVADLLDNKITVANKFAVEFGLNYNTTADTITHGMAIAAAVTPTSTTEAIALIGVPDIS